jgi:hypothetical protein
MGAVSWGRWDQTSSGTSVTSSLKTVSASRASPVGTSGSTMKGMFEDMVCRTMGFIPWLKMLFSQFRIPYLRLIPVGFDHSFCMSMYKELQSTNAVITIAPRSKFFGPPRPTCLSGGSKFVQTPDRPPHQFSVQALRSLSRFFLHGGEGFAALAQLGLHRFKSRAWSDWTQMRYCARC